jgi:glyoxylate reductase
MRYTVVLTADFPAITTELLSPHFDVIRHPTEHGRTEEEMITLLSEADAAITLLTDPITRKVLESNPNLRVISNFAVGYNNIDVAAASELGVTITNTPGVLTEATADLTMALILAVTRRVVQGHEEIHRERRCEWEPLKLLGSSLQGKVLGVIGMGRIGSAVATRATAFGMHVIGSRRGDPIAPLLSGSDVVTLHAPLTPETHHLIDAKALARMKQGACLINTARGALVDEVALCEALEAGHLAGAGLDVYEHEPEIEPRLLAIRSAVLLPHIGSATVETRNDMARLAATNVLEFFRGRQPQHRVVSS